MKSLTLLIALCILHIGFGQQIFDSKVYSTCVNKIESIDPNTSKFDDLQFLKEKLQNKQIMILGESGHGDGATFQAKTRLVKFLTTQTDFRTIAFEGGGFFEMYYANVKTTDSKGFVSELQKSWYDIWSGSAQIKELLKYLSENREQVKTIGIENQAGTAYWTEFPAIVKELAGESAFHGLKYDSFDSNFKNFYGSMYIDTTYKADIPQLKSDLKTIRENLSKTQNQHSKPLIQGVLNIEGFIRQMELNFGSYDEQNQSISMRDSLMVENVKWWIRNNPDRKLIIWTANFHAVDNLQQAIYAEGDNFYQVMKSLGQRLKSEYGEKVFNMAFTSSQGYSGNIYESEANQLVADPDSWEAELSKQIKFDYAFVDFGKTGSMRKYKNYAFNSLLLGFRNRKATWLNMFDAVFYIRTMYRSDAAN
ncbi:MAG: erythromycin esterase family protein [Fluviicola sp.]